MSHAQWMRRCLELAARAEGRTHPNPMVGAAVVDASGALISEGYHVKAGRPHAEVVALKRAGNRAKGATLYVSLEPCNHHGRTPPCAPQILSAGIAKVVYGAPDPIAGHSGGGAWLRRRGVAVTGSVLAKECREQNRGFFSVAERHRPFVVAKVACSLDGRIATSSGQSQWITGPKARADGHRLRDKLDAIIVGVGTVIADDPRLTSRGHKRARDPVRVVVDSKLRTPTGSRILPANSASEAACIIATTASAPKAPERRLLAAGATVWRMQPGRGGRVSLARLMRRLAKAGLLTALVEGGAELHTALIDGDWVDELRLYLAPLALGGTGPAWFAGKGAASLAKAPKFDYVGRPERLGDDLAVVLRRRKTRGA